MRSPQFKPQAFLANLALFKELAPAEIDLIAEGTTELRVPRGHILFNKGDPCNGFHCVVYGQVKLVFLAAQGAEKVVDLVGPGFSFGEALMFMERPYILTAQTLADAFLLHISKQVVFESIAREPEFAKKMLAGLSTKLHGLIADVESYSLQSGTQRVIGYLLRDWVGGEDEAARYTVTLPASKAIVASRLNLTPEHFSRILHDLTDAGFIRVDRRDVQIIDPVSLRIYQN